MVGRRRVRITVIVAVAPTADTVIVVLIVAGV